MLIYIRNFFLFIILMLALLVAGWKLSRNTNFQVFGELVPRVETDQKVVALTFDDGPTAGKTEQILSILNEQKVKATFFLVGSAIEENPKEAARIVAAGHEVGNHSFTHSRMVLKTPEFVRSEIESTDTLIAAHGYTDPVHFRPPYGKKLFTLPYYLNSVGKASITWDVAPESELGLSASPKEITDYVLEHVSPGSIILLHVMFDSRKNSLAAVPQVIEGLRARGYRFVTVSQLLELDSKRG